MWSPHIIHKHTGAFPKIWRSVLRNLQGDIYKRLSLNKKAVGLFYRPTAFYVEKIEINPWAHSCGASWTSWHGNACWVDQDGSS